jgi:hypothetical protein
VSDDLRLLEGIGDPTAMAPTTDQMVSALSVEALRSWIGELSRTPQNNARDALLLSALQKLAETSPLEALRLVVALNSASAEKLVRKVADVSASSDPQAVYQFGSSLPAGPLRDKIWAAAIRGWSDKDPSAAFRFLAPLKSDEGGSLLSIAAKKVALKNPEEAFQMLDLIQDPSVWDATAGTVFQVFAEKDLPAARDLLLQQTDANVGISLGYALGSVYADRSVADGVDVLNQIGDPAVADHFIHGMIQRLNKKDMTPLMENVSRIENPDYRQIMIGSTARDLSKVDPARATDWISTISDDKERALAYQGVGLGYAETDSQSAELWLQTLPPGQDRRYAIFGFATQNATKNPQQSATWALQIAEPDVRERLLRLVLYRWTNQNPAQAQSWAASAGYSNLVKLR